MATTLDGVDFLVTNTLRDLIDARVDTSITLDTITLNYCKRLMHKQPKVLPVSEPYAAFLSQFADPRAMRFAYEETMSVFKPISPYSRAEILNFQWLDRCLVKTQRELNKYHVAM